MNQTKKQTKLITQNIINCYELINFYNTFFKNLLQYLFSSRLIERQHNKQLKEEMTTQKYGSSTSNL